MHPSHLSRYSGKLDDRDVRPKDEYAQHWCMVSFLPFFVLGWEVRMLMSALVREKTEQAMQIISVWARMRANILQRFYVERKYTADHPSAPKPPW